MKATYDWIFIIDADEWLGYEDEDILRKVTRLFAQDYKDVVLCPSIINHDKHKICSLGRFF